ncbi:hypothetical protein H4582DRAFT_2099453 [Lactarius indigo]|nr:hypothetical protein H4582DRAFT_2099453 [Lactarius indigo]
MSTVRSHLHRFAVWRSHTFSQVNSILVNEHDNCGSSSCSCGESCQCQAGQCKC